MTITKRKLITLLKSQNVKAEIRGVGENWEVELPNEFNYRKFRKALREYGVLIFGGYKTGYGAWVMRPNYVIDEFEGFCG